MFLKFFKKILCRARTGFFFFFVSQLTKFRPKTNTGQNSPLIYITGIIAAESEEMGFKTRVKN